MNFVLFLGSLVLALSLGRILQSHGGPDAFGRACRRAYLVGAGLGSLTWCWLYANRWTAWYAVLLAVAGGLAGAVVASLIGRGFVENNAAPSADVREKVLAYHLSGDLEYPHPPVLKRAFDIVGALVGIVVTMPLWLVIAAFVWFEEPGPVFFIKNSVGKGGVTFRQVKFRSMKFAAERLTGPVASPAGDPRTLKIGRLLRRWHLDELPELVNVLAGTMSLVGPRPLRTVLVEGNLAEVPGFAERHTVKPGIACTAQIEKYHIAPAERLAKDLDYIAHMSLALDIRLLARAVSTTLRGERHRGQPVPVDARRVPGAAAGPTGSVGHARGVVPGWKGQPIRPATRPRAGRRPAWPTPTNATAPNGTAPNATAPNAAPNSAAPTRTLRRGGRD